MFCLSVVWVSFLRCNYFCLIPSFSPRLYLLLNGQIYLRVIFFLLHNARSMLRNFVHFYEGKISLFIFFTIHKLYIFLSFSELDSFFFSYVGSCATHYVQYCRLGAEKQRNLKHGSCWHEKTQTFWYCLKYKPSTLHYIVTQC